MPLPKSKHSSDRTLVTTCLLRSNTSVNPSKQSTQPRLRAHHRKNRTAKRIGFQTPSDTTNNPLRPIVLSKLSYLHLIPYQKHMFSKDQSLFPTHRKLPIRAAANLICSYQLKNRNFNILCLPLSLQSFEIVNFLTTSSPLFETLQRTIMISSNLGLSISSRIPSIGEHYLNEMGQENWQRWE
jgi:hypothetical protein